MALTLSHLHVPWSYLLMYLSHSFFITCTIILLELSLTISSISSHSCAFISQCAQNTHATLCYTIHKLMLWIMANALKYVLELLWDSSKAWKKTWMRRFVGMKMHLGVLITLKNGVLYFGKKSPTRVQWLWYFPDQIKNKISNRKFFNRGIVIKLVVFMSCYYFSTS